MIKQITILLGCLVLMSALLLILGAIGAPDSQSSSRNWFTWDDSRMIVATGQELLKYSVGAFIGFLTGSAVKEKV
ncbi:hypothetical protein [Pleionea sp. CnH1-48]|uniref:hypothetical protein n=1 Tax=Pleionea sp. CnH1-48 TaxID=2954494 RepID=UPI002096CD81|nr:hypothetical protein [Pleionea sp. CnH1-48]MCO7223222.1 hypothetical protein [Pleionea sp. CnH1-48]